MDLHELAELESRPLTDTQLKDYVYDFRKFVNCVAWLAGAAGDSAVLSRLIENTGAAVHNERSMGWEKQLARVDIAQAVRPEDRWERTIWRKWRPFKNNMPVSGFHALAPKILSYQLPLYGKQVSEGWGKVDLVGISPAHLPVVIEVKAENAKDSPIAVVLEAVRYGIALRELWTRGLREEWTAALENLGIGPKQPLPLRLEQCQLICAAPAEYWMSRGPTSSSSEADRTAWDSFRGLCDKLAQEHRLPVEFVKLEFSATTLNL